MIRSLLWALLLLPVGACAEVQLPELRLVYTVSWGSMSLGEAQVRLFPRGGENCYRYQSISKPSGLVRMFYGAPSEYSDFCIQQGRIRPRRFEHDHPRKKEESFTLWFEGDRVRSESGKRRALPPQAQDRLSIHQAVRLWVLSQVEAAEPGTVEFPMVEDDRIKPYRFGITGSAPIEVPAGRFDTIVVERINDPRKVTKFWLAPAVHYMPVRVERLRDGKLELRMELKSR